MRLNCMTPGLAMQGLQGGRPAGRPIPQGGVENLNEVLLNAILRNGRLVTNNAAWRRSILTGN
jgi:hypothetical protein